MVALELLVVLATVLGLLLSARQLAMAGRIMTRSARPQPLKDLGDPGDADWPTVTVVIPAHNEERVIGGCLEAMIALDYRRDRITVLVVDDRSTDATGAIADDFARRDVTVRVLHRGQTASPGKSAAVADAMELMSAEVVVLFDADYL